MQFVMVFLSAALVNNIVLSRSLGICHVASDSKRLETAFGLGVVVTFIVTVSSTVSFVLYTFVLRPLGLSYLYLVVFLLVIALSAIPAQSCFKRVAPKTYLAMNIKLPLIFTNCAVLGAVLLSVELFGGSFAVTIAYALGAGTGFTLVMVLFSGIRERLAASQIAPALQGLPIALIILGLMSITFFGLTGLVHI